MPPRSIPVSVNFICTGVSYNNGVWSGSPNWNVPPKVQVHPGENTISWNLTGAAANGYTMQFTSDGVSFPASSNWPGGPPQKVNASTMQAADNFTSITQATDYYYQVKVEVTAAGGQSKTFLYDPEVENEPN